MINIPTALHTNPFYTLEVTTRDNSSAITEAAEQRSLLIDHDICQKARADLINPRTRLAVEMAWMPGIAPRISAALVNNISNAAPLFQTELSLPPLTHANLMSAAFEALSDETLPNLVSYIRKFCAVVDLIDVNDVLRDINEDRAISGFPEVRTLDMVTTALSDRRKTYRATLKRLLDSLEPRAMTEIVTEAISLETRNGKISAPTLLEELVDIYEVDSQGILGAEQLKLIELIQRARQAATSKQQDLATIIGDIEKVARNWDRIAQPIQVNAKSRGTNHRESNDIAYELRSLAIDLFNEHDMLGHSQSLNSLLRELFAEVPEIAERLDEDAEALAGITQQIQERQRNEAEWVRAATFKAEVGLIFKDQLAISPDGITWKGRNYPLDTITRVRWGGVRRSVNGIPTGTEFTVAFGTNKSEQVIFLKKEQTFSGFIHALWPAVCLRLLVEMAEALRRGDSLIFGDIVVQNEQVILTRNKFLGASERKSFGWDEVHVWTADGNFFIGKRDDRKFLGTASYIDVPNTHILEHLIRGGFKKGIRKLSDYLDD